MLTPTIHKIKIELERKVVDDNEEKISAEQQHLRDKLRVWLNNAPLYMILQWFDTREEVNISSQIKNKQWDTEVTARDQIFLEMLGISK